MAILMTGPHQDDPPSKRWLPITLLTIFIILIYSNSFDASWHFDDYSNITRNARLHISEISVQSLVQVFYAKPGVPDKLFRPLPNLSFALNWYIGRTQLAGYHFVNLSIHIISAVVLYLFILRLFQSPRLRKYPREDHHFVALLAAMLWAANPIQVQAVTYIVQRMATMAAMFYIISMYAYLRARQAVALKGQVLGYAGCVLGYLAAVTSKENAAMLPFSIVLLEFCCFTDWENPQAVKRYSIIAGILMVLAGLLALIASHIFIEDGVGAFLRTGYDKFSFNIWERLLTEPRVLIFYLSQILYPVPHRLSIEHDIAVSTSLMTPWTTLPAILLILTLITIGIYTIKRHPLITLGVLFFFINHAVESTLLPLDLIFEHRNYLPSMLLFLPLALGIQWALKYYARKRRPMYWMGVGFLTVLLFMSGVATYTRNRVWYSEKSLWTDAMLKAPDFARPYHNIAWGYFEPLGQYDEALAFYHRALEKKDHFKHNKYLRYNNIAVIHAKRGELEQAAHYYRQSIEAYPLYLKAYLRLAKIHIRLGNLSDAEETIDQMLQREPELSTACNLKGLILIKQERPKDAIPYLKKSLRTDVKDRQALLYMGWAHVRLGNPDKAASFLKRAQSVYPQDPSVQWVLLEAALARNDPALAHAYADRLLAMLPLGSFDHLLQGHNENMDYLDLDLARIVPLLVDRMRTATNTLWSNAGD